MASSSFSKSASWVGTKFTSFSFGWCPNSGCNQGTGDCIRVRSLNMHNCVDLCAARPRGHGTHGQKGASKKSKQAVELVVLSIDNSTNNIPLHHLDHSKLHLAHIAGEEGLGLGHVTGIFRQAQQLACPRLSMLGLKIMAAWYSISDLEGRAWMEIVTFLLAPLTLSQVGAFMLKRTWIPANQ